MNNFDSLVKFFKGGNAEAEKDIRGEVFVKPGNFTELLNFDFHSTVILLGNKGVGKSIFVNVLHEAFLENNELSLLLTPDDLECDPILSKKTLADKKSAAYGQISKSIAGIIGKHSIGNEIAISSNVTALQQLAIKEGYSKPDLISRLAKVLAQVTPHGGKFATALLAEQGRELGKNNMTEVIDAYLTTRNKTLWLFIDDIDAAVAQSEKGAFDYAACWAIVSAAIELSEDIESLRCVVSIRSDIWHLMTKVHRHGTERRDKLGNIQELKFTEDEIKNIFLKRISLAAETAQSTSGLTSFFQANDVTLPGSSGAKRGWAQWIAKTSRNKPRDMVKMVQNLIAAAKRDKSERIGDNQVHSILIQYGEERVSNIVDEYGGICPQIKEIIDDLTVQNTYTFAQVFEILIKAPARRAIQVDGLPMQQTNDSAIQLLRLLHMACFINPRLDTEDEYVHFNYSDFPNMVDLAKLNDLQKYTWQIHPTFHSYTANIKKRNNFLTFKP